MRKKICIGLLAVLLGTGLGAMIVNHIWKEPKQGVDLGATQMIVKELTVQTLGQVSCSDSVKENLRESGKDIKIPVLTVDIKNLTKDSQSFTIYKVNLEVGKWSSAVSWDLFPEMNDNSELVWSIPAGETKTIVIPYVAYRQLMSESDWEKLDQDNMKLRFSVVQGSITVNVK